VDRPSARILLRTPKRIDPNQLEEGCTGPEKMLDWQETLDQQKKQIVL